MGELDPVTLRDVKTILGVVSATAVVVWRLGVVQAKVSGLHISVEAQNGRIGDLEEHVVYKETSDAKHEQHAQAISRIQENFDRMDGKQEDIMHLMNRFYHHTHPPAGSGGPTQLHGG